MIIKYTKSQPKPELVASSSEKLIVDIFANPDQKIVATRTISVQYDKSTHKAQAQATLIVKSTGLGLDVNVNHVGSVDPKALTGSLKLHGIVNVNQHKYENLVKLSVSPKEVSALLKALNNVVLDLQSKIEVQKGNIDINSQIIVFGYEPIETDLQIKNYNTLTITRFLKSEFSRETHVIKM